MREHFKKAILKFTKAASLVKGEMIQSLWSGYGEIRKIHLENASMKSVVVKNIRLPQPKDHPRGWKSDFGHKRKVKSYEVESYWYQEYAKNSKARLPKFLGMEKQDDEIMIVLEDLDAAGFPVRKSQVTWQEVKICIKWLADFHASFMGKMPVGVWEIGTYWHLATRPEELEALEDFQLKEAAHEIDEVLNRCTYKTFVHGDAKLANFCFSKEGEVAAVDFQYVGGGCGMKDLAYFIGSCMDEKEAQHYETKVLDYYFENLKQKIGRESDTIEQEWRPMYRYAWADFHRFMKGWSPGHWKINDYSERVTQSVLQELGKWN